MEIKGYDDWFYSPLEEYKEEIEEYDDSDEKFEYERDKELW